MHNTSGSPVLQLTPGQPRQLLGEAIQHVKSLPRDAAKRVDAFEAWPSKSRVTPEAPGVPLAAQARTAPSFSSEGQGEGLVVTLDGRIFRGASGRGIDITPNGLEPNLGSMTPLD
jgi:hypothetical protein